MSKSSWDTAALTSYSTASSHKPALQDVASSGALQGLPFLQLSLHTINGIMSTTGKLQLNSCVYSFPMGTPFCVDAKHSEVIRLSLFTDVLLRDLRCLL